MEELPKLFDATSPLDFNLPEGWVELAPALPAVGILAGLSDASLANIASFGKYHQLTTGTVLIKEGQLQDRFYVVVTGRLEVLAEAGGKELRLSEAKPGECIGELSLLDPGPASATVRVIRNSTLWSMNIEDFRTYLAEHVGGGGALLLGMAACLSQRLRYANELICRHHIKPVETLPAGRERAITADNTPVQIGFFDRLKKSMGSTKKVSIPTRIKM